VASTSGFLRVSGQIPHLKTTVKYDRIVDVNQSADSTARAAAAALHNLFVLYQCISKLQSLTFAQDVSAKLLQ
jgi:hypothetical protein